MWSKSAAIAASCAAEVGCRENVGIDGDVAVADGDDGQEEEQSDDDEYGGEHEDEVDERAGMGTARSSSRSLACADGQRARA